MTFDLGMTGIFRKICPLGSFLISSHLLPRPRPPSISFLFFSSTAIGSSCLLHPLRESLSRIQLRLIGSVFVSFASFVLVLVFNVPKISLVVPQPTM